MSTSDFDISAYPQTPLGGRLVERVLAGDELEAARERASRLPALMVDREAEITLEMLATGVFSPLTGFLLQEENESVTERGRLPDGTPWPIPLSMAPAGRRNAEVLKDLSVGDEVALLDRSAEVVALLEIEEIYPYDRERRADSLFGTTDSQRHPGVASIYRRMGDTALGGPIWLLRRPGWGAFERYRLTPHQSYELLYRYSGFRSVTGFITGANPPHLAHEYMHRVALEHTDGVLLLPQVEMERREYIKAHHRIMSLEALRDVYYPPFRVILSALRTNYLFAGPREAVLHVLIMRNYGCTHAIVGRDHAGVGDIYDLYAGQHAFAEYSENELGIVPMFFSEIFYCTRCRLPASESTCCHDSRYRIQISGTGIREVLRRGYLPPKEICRPEVSQIAIQGVLPPGADESGRTIYPVGQTMHSLFPFYEVATRLGGHLRDEIVRSESMGERDLEAALLDVRSHADRVYNDVFEDVASASEVNRNLGERWRMEAREILGDHQAEVIRQLEDKREGVAGGEADLVGSTLEEVDEELRVAREVLADYPPPLRQDRTSGRMVGKGPYDRYRNRGHTEEDEADRDREDA